MSVFVAPDGDNGNLGTSFPERWETPQYALDTVDPTADDIRVCADDTTKFDISATIDIDGVGGTPTISAPYDLIGCDLIDGSPYDGAGKAPITTTTLGLTNGLIQFYAASSYIKMRDILLDGGGSGYSSYCLYCASANTNDMSFERCRFTNASSHNVNHYALKPWNFNLCEIDLAGRGGSGQGIFCPSTNRCFISLTNCKIHHNASAGAHIGMSSTSGSTSIKGNMVYRNGGVGLIFTYSGGTLNLDENIIAFNGSHGLSFNSTSIQYAFLNNNIFRLNGGFNIFTNTGFLSKFIMRNNASTNIQSGHIDINSGVLPGTPISANVLTDPYFVDEDNDNYFLQRIVDGEANDSPCLLARSSAFDI